MARAHVVAVALLLLASCAQEICGHRKLLRTLLHGGVGEIATRAAQEVPTAGTNASAIEGIAVLAHRGAPALLASWETWRSKFATAASHLSAGISVAVVVKIACVVGNVLVQVGPIPQVQDWEGRASAGNVEATPYLMMAVGSWQWCTFCFAAWALSNNDSVFVLVCANCLGTLLGCYITFAFHRHCRSCGTSGNLRQFVVAVVSLACVQICLWLLLPPARALAVHRFIAGSCSIASAAVLLNCLLAILRMGDTSGLCGPLIAANAFGAFVWAYWGWLMNDPVVIAANMFAAFSSSICLYVKLLFEARRPRSDSVDGTKMGQPWARLMSTSGGKEYEEEPYL